VLAVPATDLDPQLALLGLVLDRADDAVVLVEQLAPLVGGGGEALELARGVLVGVVDVEGVLEGLEGALRVAEVGLVDMRHLLGDRDLEARLLEDLDLTEEQLDQRAPILGLAVDGLQRFMGGHVALVQLEDLEVDAGGLGLVADLLLPDPGDLHQHVDLLGHGLDDLALALEDLHDLLPAGLAAVKALERREGLEAVGLELDDVAPRVDRRVGVHQVLGLDPADLRIVVAGLVGPEHARTEIDQARQDVVELDPALAVLVDAVQGGQRLDVAAVDLEGVEPRVEGVAVLAEPIAVDLAEGLIDVDLLVGVVDGVDLPLEHLGQLLPPLRALVETRELSEREGILAAEVDDLGPQIDGVGLSAEGLGRELGHALIAGRGVLVGVGDRGHLLVGVVQVLPALGGHVERLETLERGHVARVDVDRAVVRGDRRLGVGQPLLVGAGERISRSMRTSPSIVPLMRRCKMSASSSHAPDWVYSRSRAASASACSALSASTLL
jgi:hypothetical protein